MKEEWCKECDEYMVERGLKLSDEEVRIIINLFDSEWVCFLDKEEENLLDKLYKFVEGGE